MKKIIMLLTVMALLATSVIGVSAVDYTAGEDGKYTGVAYSGLTANEYYGVVVVEGTTAASVDFSNKDSILYIDQVTADNTGAITIPAFMTKGTDLVEGTIFIGGAGLPTATNIGYLKLAQSSEPEMIVISGTIEGHFGTKTTPAVVVTDGTKIYTANVDLTNSTFTVEVPANVTYTLNVTKTGYLGYTKTNIAAATDAVVAKIKAGNVNGDEYINLSDLGLLLGSFDTSVETIEKDFDESGAVNLTDLGKLLSYFDQGAVIE